MLPHDWWLGKYGRNGIPSFFATKYRCSVPFEAYLLVDVDSHIGLKPF